MDRTDWFLSLIVFFVAAITLELTSPATSDEFREFVGLPAILVLYFLPVYLVIHLARSRIGE